jgi:hypothetical protein
MHIKLFAKKLSKGFIGKSYTLWHITILSMFFCDSYHFTHVSLLVLTFLNPVFNHSEKVFFAFKVIFCMMISQNVWKKFYCEIFVTKCLIAKSVSF